MTLIAAVADQKYALLFSDTRGSYFDPDDDSDRPVSFSDDCTKVRPVGSTAWFASGPSAEWDQYLHTLAAQTDGSLEAIRAAFQRETPDRLRELERTAPRRAQNIREKHMCFVIGLRPDGALYAAHWKWADERVEFTARSQVIGYTADEVIPKLPQLVQSCQRELLLLRGTKELGPPLSAVARFVRAVAGVTNRVGPLMEAGCLFRTGGRLASLWLDRMPHQAVIENPTAFLEPSSQASPPITEGAV